MSALWGIVELNTCISKIDGLYLISIWDNEGEGLGREFSFKLSFEEAGELERALHDITSGRFTALSHIAAKLEIGKKK